MTPYIFGVLEFVSAAIYGKSSAQVVGALVDVERTRLRMWLPIAVLSYFPPIRMYFLVSGGSSFQVGTIEAAKLLAHYKRELV